MAAQAIAAAASVGLPIIMGMIGDAVAAGDDAEAERLYKQAQERFGAVNVPSLDEMKLGPSALEKVNVDPVAKEAQRRAYGRLMEMGTQTGLSVEDRAALDEARAETSRQEQGQRGAILESARARGVSGSGMEMQAQLMAQQGGADRNAAAGVNAAGEARRRAMQALVAAGGAAGQARGQDWQEQSGKAQATDAISQFNANNVKWKHGADTEKAGTMADFDMASGDRKGARADKTRRRFAGYGQGATQAVNAFGGGGA